MSGFEVEIADMDLIKQVFDRQETHMTAIKSYVTSHCVTPGGFGIVLSPLEPHYTRAYDDGVTGLGNGATVAQACSTKIGETKQALLETDRKQYQRYAKHEAELGHDVPPYKAPAGGGTLPPASGGYTAPGEESEYPSIEQPYTFLADKGYDAFEGAARAGHTPEHAAPAEPDSDTAEGGDHRADGDTDASSSGSSDSGSSDTGSSGSSDGDSSSGSSSGSSGGGDSDGGPQHRAGHGGHEAEDEPNVVAKATEIYNAPGDYIETGKDYAETVETRNDLDEAENGPSNDDQTEWANSGSSF